MLFRQSLHFPKVPVFYMRFPPCLWPSTAVLGAADKVRKTACSRGAGKRQSGTPGEEAPRACGSSASWCWHGRPCAGQPSRAPTARGTETTRRAASVRPPRRGRRRGSGGGAPSRCGGESFVSSQLRKLQIQPWFNCRNDFRACKGNIWYIAVSHQNSVLRIIHGKTY